MSAVCVFTPKALVDLDHIWTVSENRWGSDQADTYVRQIAKHADVLAARPDLGPLAQT